MNKFTVVLVAYKDIPKEVELKIKERMLREIDEPSDIDLHSSLIGLRGSMNLNSRTDIYIDWYRKAIRNHLSKGYNLALLELPFDNKKDKVKALNHLDEEYGDNILVLECDDI